MICLTMGDYPGRKQVRNRVKRATKNDRIVAKHAAAGTTGKRSEKKKKDKATRLATKKPAAKK